MQTECDYKISTNFFLFSKKSRCYINGTQFIWAKGYRDYCSSCRLLFSLYLIMHTSSLTLICSPDNPKLRWTVFIWFSPKKSEIFCLTQYRQSISLYFYFLIMQYCLNTASDKFWSLQVRKNFKIGSGKGTLKTGSANPDPEK